MIMLIPTYFLTLTGNYKYQILTGIAVQLDTETTLT